MSMKETSGPLQSRKIFKTCCQNHSDFESHLSSIFASSGISGLRPNPPSSIHLHSSIFIPPSSFLLLHSSFFIPPSSFLHLHSSILHPPSSIFHSRFQRDFEPLVLNLLPASDFQPRLRRGLRLRLRLPASSFRLPASILHPSITLPPPISGFDLSSFSFFLLSLVSIIQAFFGKRTFLIIDNSLLIDYIWGQSPLLIKIANEF